MALQRWERQYLDALVRTKTERIEKYENLEFFSSIFERPYTAVQELLLHRLISSLTSTDQALQLLFMLRGSELDRYGARVFARIADTEALIKERPELKDFFAAIRKKSNYTTAALKDWHIISDGNIPSLPDAPIWTRQCVPITEVIEKKSYGQLTLEDINSILHHFYTVGVRVFQLAIITFANKKPGWANTLHRVLASPYIEIGPDLEHMRDIFSISDPSKQWTPHWQISPASQGAANWKIVDVHTSQQLNGIGSSKIYNQISVILQTTGLLRDGINLTPIDEGLVRAITPSHPIWGFRRKDFSVSGTEYDSFDIRALALGFLEKFSSILRISVFRSRLMMQFGIGPWDNRASASILTTENGLYQTFVRASKLFAATQFQETLEFIQKSEFSNEPALQFLKDESLAALELYRRIAALPHSAPPVEAQYPERILCVAHASVPDQSGGYAIRAHGILKSLHQRGVEISAVTRPGFPLGPLTHEESISIDDVSYHRLVATDVLRERGEIQHMMSFIEPFKRYFKEEGIGFIHARSTFLIALPALIAARELGLKFLYEVSGLWELVYQDREDSAYLMKRAPFAELAETLTMTAADQVVVMNQAVKDIALNRGVKETAIRIAPNAVDVQMFTPMDSPTNDVFTIGYLGSFQDYEGLDDIVDAVGYLRKRGITVNVIMVGDGVRFRTIHAKIVAAGLENQFKMTGRVPHAEVIKYYQEIDVMVYPRRSTGATETITPLKPFEALALAKPIIVSDVAPLQEIVGHEQRGLVFQNGNIEDFAQKIKEYIEDKGLRVRLGQRGREWVVANRNWENVVDSFVDAYEQLGWNNMISKTT